MKSDSTEMILVHVDRFAILRQLSPDENGARFF
jgi:hypothetical protein